MWALVYTWEDLRWNRGILHTYRLHALRSVQKSYKQGLERLPKAQSKNQHRKRSKFRNPEIQKNVQIGRFWFPPEQKSIQSPRVEREIALAIPADSNYEMKTMRRWWFTWSPPSDSMINKWWYLEERGFINRPIYLFTSTRTRCIPPQNELVWLQSIFSTTDDLQLHHCMSVIRRYLKVPAMFRTRESWWCTRNKASSPPSRGSKI